MTTPPVLDSDTLLNLRRLGGAEPEALLKKLFGLLSATLEKQGAAIQQAAKELDHEGLFRAAHAIKGSSSSIGALQVADVCGRIEVAARLQQSGVYGTLLAELVAAVTRLRAATTQYQQGKP